MTMATESSLTAYRYMQSLCVEFEWGEESVGDGVVAAAGGRAGFGAGLEHSGPGRAEGRVAVMGAEGVLECADDDDLNGVQAEFDRLSDITFPGLSVDVSGVFAVDRDSGDAAAPVGQADAVFSDGLSDYEFLFV